MPTTVAFAEVKAILDKTIADWKVENGFDPDLVGVHATTQFSWDTKEELLASSAFGMPLIAPNVIGQNPPCGDQSNLVIALRKGVPGVPPAPDFPRMPFGGPFRTEAEIQVIVDWIDGGCQ